jgi:hypothetical protein
MMEFMVEMIITAFAFGGILGAVIALHLSANLKQTSRDSTPVSLELPRHDGPAELRRVPVKAASHRPASGQRRRP